MMSMEKILERGGSGGAVFDTSMFCISVLKPLIILLVISVLSFCAYFFLFYKDARQLVRLVFLKN